MSVDLYTCVCVCLSALLSVYVCVCVCLSVCVVCEAAVPLWLEVSLLTKRSPVQCPAAAVVSLSKELYSHCSSAPSCINGDLAIAEESNAKLCMSHLMVEVQVGLRVPTPSSMRHVQPSCRPLVPSPGGFVLKSACLEPIWVDVTM